MNLKVLWLYAKDMNIYGDYGNILALKKQMELRGISFEIIEYNPGDVFPEDVDIVIGGGGQDSGQGQIQDDLLKIAPKLRKLASNGVPMLVVCGLYQLFGNSFETASGEKIKGIGIFRGVKTIGGSQRMIGNIVENSDQFGEIIGYENHSGKTYLSEHVKPLAEVKIGAGNLPDGEFEGACYRNVIGTYLHGSLLPKNPEISLFLIEQALKNKDYDMPRILYGNIRKANVLKRITNNAREIAKKCPR